MSQLSHLVLIFLLMNPMEFQKRFREKGESDYPFLVNMWIPKNKEVYQENPRFCDAIQLTPFTDYFFTSAKCFDYLEHDMWLEDIGISWDENIVTYSRHMSFLTRYKEEGGHFVILERFENNPLDSTNTRRNETEDDPTIDETVKNINKPDEFEFMTQPTRPKRPEQKPGHEICTERRRYSERLNLPPVPDSSDGIENLDEEYDRIPPDLAQYDDLEDMYEIKEQIQDDIDMKYLRSLRNKRVRLSTPDVRGATECYLLGWGTYLKNYDDIRDLEGLILQKEVVRKLPRKQCRSSDPAHICITRDNEKRECVEDLGSPLVCERRDRRNNTIGVALVGIYTGFKNCATAEKGIFRSLSSELPWIARWAKGTPITINAFERRAVNSKHSPRRSRDHKRGRSGSCEYRITFKYILVIHCLAFAIYLSILQ